MNKLDLRKDFKHLYLPSGKAPQVVDVPTLNFLMIDGSIEKGVEPETSPLLEENMQALYGMAYTLKFIIKNHADNPVDYPVMPMEGLWWVEDGHFDINMKDNWLFSLMIMVPDLVTPDLFTEALAQMRNKKGNQPGFARLRLEPFREGLCVQMMHIGPYASEPVTINAMRAFMAENGYLDLVEHGGKHHEIYLGDPRKAAPEKLKTILRYPVRKG